MEIKDIAVDDVVTLKWNELGYWDTDVLINPNNHDCVNIDAVVLAKHFDISQILVLFDQNKVRSKMAYSSHNGKRVVWVDPRFVLTKRSPLSIGSIVNVVCYIWQNAIVHIGSDDIPVFLNVIVEERGLPIIGSKFIESDCKYYYALHLPKGSNTGAILDPISIWFHNYSIDRKFTNEVIGFVNEDFIVKRAAPQKSAMICMNKHCRAEAPYADSPNCPNGVFMCFSCRNNPVTYAIVMGRHGDP